MVVAISDLHFEEEGTDTIVTPDLQQRIALRRNVPHRVFERLIAARRVILGRREKAREDMATATAMYRDMGMTHWLEQTEAEMLRLQ